MTSPASSPVLSVIMPVYNVEPWLEETLSSILHDQDVSLELIAIDDASTDASRAILEQWAAKDDRLRVVDNEGGGGAGARNLGAQLATGDLIAFADSDDLVPRNAYRTMVDQITASGSDMVVGRFMKFYPSRTWTPTLSWPAFDQARTGIRLVDQPSLIRNRACWNRVFRRDFWLANEISFPDVPRSNDVVPMVRALIAARSIDVCDAVVYLYRARPGGGSMTAQASGLVSYRSYLAQESETLRLTREAGDDALRREHEHLFVVQDGFVHLRGLLAQATTEQFDAPEWVETQAEFAATWAALLPESRTEIYQEMALFYRLVLAGRWEFAGHLARSFLRAPDDWSLELPQIMQELRRLLEEGSFDETDREHLVQAYLVRPLQRAEAALGASEGGVSAAETLYSHRDWLLEQWPEGERQRLHTGLRFLLEAVQADDLATVETYLAEPLPRATLRRAALVDGAIELTVRHRSLEDLQLLACSAAAEVVLPVERAEERRSTITIPLALLGDEEWELRLLASPTGNPELRVDVALRCFGTVSREVALGGGATLQVTPIGTDRIGVRVHVVHRSLLGRARSVLRRVVKG